MKNFCFTLLIVILSGSAGFASHDYKYAISNIPAKLLEKANLVIRNSEYKINIKSNTDIVVVAKYAITILNDEGNKESHLSEYYSSLFKITDISGRLYDKDGNIVKKMKKRDVNDAAMDTHNMADDFRKMYYDFNYADYPYTVEFEIEKQYSSFYFVNEYAFQDDYNCAVQNSSFEIEYPNDLSLKYKLYNIDVKANETITEGRKRMSLNVNNIPAKEKDLLATRQTFYFPAVALCVDKVEMGGLSGNMTNWKDYGKFFYELNKNRDNLTDDNKRVIHSIIDTCKLYRKRIDLLYDYLKENTRYISVQLGIGGWQTKDAKSVIQYGYGDCKALSNYMMAILKEAGFTPYAALIYGGNDFKRVVDKDFPVDMFNHVILCVPVNNDTTWIECTSDNLNAGYLSEFTDNRDALLITPDGGILVRTPKYSVDNNLLIRKLEIQVNASGGLTGKGWFTRKAEFWLAEEYFLKSASKKDIESKFNSDIDISSFKLIKYEPSSTVVSKIPIQYESIVFEGDAKINTSGDRVFVSPFIMELPLPKMPSNEKREKSFYLSRSYQVVDTIAYSFEGIYKSEMMPKDVQIDYRFGTFTSKAAFDNVNKLVVTKTLKLYEGEYEAYLYAEYLKFLKQVSLRSGDNSVVFLKQ
ncbi:MAG: DUF3857 domain-containing protein [Bacteroidetes bacterium]|nr:DUF3857 domain-containing protein [Bacteroidota bacterium]